MKKLLILALTVLGLTGMAAFQYEYVAVDGGYVLRVTEGSGPIFFGNQHGGRDNANLFDRYTIGWYNYDSANPTPSINDVTWMTEATFQNPYYNGNLVYMGEFSAGDEIGFYFVGEGREGATTGDWSDVLGVRTEPTTEGNEPWIYWGDIMFDTGSGLPDDFIRFAVQTLVPEWHGGWELGDQATAPGGGTPSGQPLPGVLACLLLGGGALGFSRLKKARA